MKSQLPEWRKKMLNRFSNGAEFALIPFIKKLLREAEVAKPALIAAVKVMEKIYSEKSKDLEREKLARQTINTYIKMRLAEVRVLRAIAKKKD